MTTLANLALALIRDHPGASDLKLVGYWVDQVRNDDVLLDACLQQQANRAIANAHDFIAREQRAKKRQERQKKLATMLAKAAADQQASSYFCLYPDGRLQLSARTSAV